MDPDALLDLGPLRLLERRGAIYGLFSLLTGAAVMSRGDPRSPGGGLRR
jgi:hypothetical protein